MKITASMLYNYIQCPHRVTMDLFGDPSLRDSVSPFVQLLWEKGNLFEAEVIESLQVPFENLRVFSGRERAAKTVELMAQKAPLIYGARISAADLLGDPDLLRLADGGYVAGDIKSGAGLEGNDENKGRPKKHYAVQLGLYTDILEKMGACAGRTPFIWDINGAETVYRLDDQDRRASRRSLWDIYEYTLESVRIVLQRSGDTRPALAAVCKLCPWKGVCKQELKATDDLTLIPELGRSRRNVMLTQFTNVADLAESDLAHCFQGGATVFSRIGPDMLRTFHERARLLCDKSAAPYLKAPVELPDTETALFFDIETDPFRDICYLHGFVEQQNGDPQTEKYTAFLMQTPTTAEEERAFQDACDYIRLKQPCAIFYYSPYERTVWRRLQQKYPGVISGKEIESLFPDSRTVDLYLDVIKPFTEWPVNDYSIKTLARFCGFSWRDSDPSGAASIEWYHRWVETGDARVRNRILAYNEDDCIAMRVLLDKIKKLKVVPGAR